MFSMCNEHAQNEGKELSMLTSKQRAYLISMASKLTPIFQIGKASMTPEIVSAVSDALEKRELVKISVLKNCSDDPREIADVISERTRSEVVHVIGKKIVLFRVSKKKPVIVLPR